MSGSPPVGEHVPTATRPDGRGVLVAVVGATATGKSDLAVDLALRLGGEVVNADSMQLYRGMDIGTAKLGTAERRGVPHQLLDIWEVTTAASVVDYQDRARRAVDGLTAAGAAAVVVGGSGLYLRAALDDLTFPGTDDAVRARWEAALATDGSAALHARLAERDPAAAAAILATNGRRIVRALEVVELTGRPYLASLPEPRYRRPTVTVGLGLPRAALDLRLARRVDRMWAAGLVEEVRGLADRGLREGRTAGRALGYAQVLRHLDGELTQDAAREDTVRATRRFARRQDSWFRRDPRIHWLDAAAGDLVEQALALVGAHR